MLTGVFVWSCRHEQVNVCWSGSENYPSPVEVEHICIAHAGRSNCVYVISFAEISLTGGLVQYGIEACNKECKN